MSTSNDTTILKRCRKCGEEKPATPEYFYRDKQRADGVYVYCKTCLRKAPPALPEGLRRCGVCKEILPATREYFTANKNGKDGLQSFCKPCGAASRRRERKANPEIFSQYEKRRKNIPERRAANRIIGAKPRPISFDRAIKRMVRNHNRRALKRGIPGTFTVDDILLQYRSQKGRCWWCQKNLNNSFQPDHLVPFDKGGANWPNNIVCSCASCNYSKGPKMPYKWIGRLL